MARALQQRKPARAAQTRQSRGGKGFGGTTALGNQVTAALARADDEPSRLLADRSLDNRAIQRLLRVQRASQRERSKVRASIRPGSIEAPRSAGEAVAVQRHSSWEHRLLGDTDPRQLAIMSGASEKIGVGQTMKVGNDDDGYEVILGSKIAHALEQEIARLEKYRTNPAFQDAQKTAEEAAAAEQLVRAWGMVPVRIPLSGGTFEVLTYGELNTMADLFGSVDDMKQHDPKNLHGLVQGIRQQSLHNMISVYDEYTGKKTERGEFKGAIGSKGASREGQSSMLGTGAKGELALMGKLPGGKKEATGGSEEKSYTSGLARNACHFAPESWHAWGDHHARAIALANQAFVKTTEAATLRQRATQDVGSADGFNGMAALAEKEADRLGNEAMLTNGFGDHFLQDSFAAGHLINKTEIMKWYVQWLDANPNFAEGSLFAKGTNITRRTPKDKAVWAPAQAMAQQKGLGVGTGRYDTSTVGQMKANDPQSVENQGGDWRDRFKALGLAIPPSVKPGTKSQQLLVWWQRHVIRDRDRKKMVFTAKRIARFAPAAGLSVSEFVNALINLTSDRVAVKEGDDDYVLREVWLPGTSRDEVRAFHESTTPTGDPQLKANRNAAYERAAERATMKDYHQFLNAGMIQAATNILHDVFCKSGLVVSSAAEQLGYKVYGDDNMLNAESSKGVELSARTSNMSRDNIRGLLTTGVQAHAITEISNRFPTSVTPTKGGTPLTLEHWHTSGVLRRYCESTVFPEGTNTMKSMAASGITSATTGSGPDEVINQLAPKISKDQLKPSEHSGEAF